MDYLGAIRLFVRAVELGSFSKVAQDRTVKISSVSRAIAALEEDLGVALFNRTTRRLHPTEAGLDFYESATRILADVESARTQTSSFNGRPQGLLKINMPVAFGRRHVMPLLPDFLKQYPEIRIEAVLTDTTVNIIEVGADLAIRIGVLPDSTLIAKKLAPHRRVLCGHPAYLDSHSAITAPEDLTAHACLTFGLLQPSDRWLFERDGKRVEVSVGGPLTASDSEALRDAALAGLGIVLLPTWLVAGDLKAGHLRLILPEWQASLAPGDRAIWGVHPPKKVVALKVRVFLDFVETRFGRPPYWDREML